MMSSPRSTVVLLLLANLVPLVGVLAYDWDVFATLALYWAENGIIGLFNLGKIAYAAHGGVGSLPFLRRLQKGFMMLFFLFYFGGFWAAHGVVVAALFAPDVLDLFFTSDDVTWGALINVLGGLEGTLGLGLLSLFISHSLSFVSDFLGTQEYLKMTPFQQVVRPFRRVVVLQVTVVVGGVLVETLGAPVLALGLLVLLKSALDLRGYRQERRKMQREEEAEDHTSAAPEPLRPTDRGTPEA